MTKTNLILLAVIKYRHIFYAILMFTKALRCINWMQNEKAMFLRLPVCNSIPKLVWAFERNLVLG
jgi:hypothetical protein